MFEKLKFFLLNRLFQIEFCFTKSIQVADFKTLFNNLNQTLMLIQHFSIKKSNNQTFKMINVKMPNILKLWIDIENYSDCLTVIILEHLFCPNF
jgi:hypothetical protein